MKCIVGNGNNTLKMADTDNFLEIINDNRKRTCLLHNLYLLKGENMIDLILSNLSKFPIQYFYAPACAHAWFL